MCGRMKKKGNIFDNYHCNHKKGALMPTSSCLFNDSVWLSSMINHQHAQFRFVNHKLSSTLCQKLHIMPLSQVFFFFLTKHNQKKKQRLGESGRGEGEGCESANFLQLQLYSLVGNRFFSKSKKAVTKQFCSAVPQEGNHFQELQQSLNRCLKSEEIPRAIVRLWTDQVF